MESDMAGAGRSDGPRSQHRWRWARSRSHRLLFGQRGAPKPGEDASQQVTSLPPPAGQRRNLFVHGGENCFWA